MSWFTFIVSDVVLDECCIGIYQDGNKIIIEDENIIMNVYREQYEGYPEQYTKLKHIVGIEIGKYPRWVISLYKKSSYIIQSIRIVEYLVRWRRCKYINTKI